MQIHHITFSENNQSFESEFFTNSSIPNWNSILMFPVFGST